MKATIKKIATLGTATFLLFSSLPAVPVEASRSTAEIESELKETKNKLSEVEKEIARIEEAIAENEKILKETEENIKTTEKEIARLNEEKEEIEARMAKREEIIKKRMATMQQMGGTFGYLDVLLGATSFEDFISRVNSLTTLAKADHTLLEEQKADAEAVKQKVAEAEAKLADLNDMKVELEGIRSVITEQKAQTESLREQLKDKEGRLLAEKEAKEREERARQLQAQLANSNAGNGKATSKSSRSVAKPSVAGGNAVDIVTSVGYQFIGNSVYVFGAADPMNGRFDCSGFVHWAFAQAGISVGRSTSSLASTGSKISKSELRPGDLVFFNTYKTNGHVGIYLGGGKFIGSQSSTGVAIANMNDSYWGPRFSQARRVIH